MGNRKEPVNSDSFRLLTPLSHKTRMRLITIDVLIFCCGKSGISGKTFAIFAILAMCFFYTLLLLKPQIFSYSLDIPC